MKECPYCHHDLPEDAVFCTYCGKSLNKNDKDKQDNKNKLKPNPHPNNFAKLALFLVVGTVIVFDFVLASIVSTITGSTAKWVFIISFVFYMLAITLAILSFVKDKQDKKAGYETSDNGAYASAAIIFSIFISLVNLTQVILK